jgi:tetratricopeptide (TPR) repeat protein
VRATGVLRDALASAQARGDVATQDMALGYLNISLMPQARYAESIEISRALSENSPPELALVIHFTWGTALALEGLHPPEAEARLREAEKLLDTPRGFKSFVTPAKLKYQLAGTLGQQGRLSEAVALYWEALAAVRADESSLDLQRHILLYNSLAYYLHLLHDPAAAEYARAGLKFARDKGSLTHQPYLYSTSGEIALANEEFEQAEEFFREGLKLAEQLRLQERIAGLSANLGLVARAQGERFEQALGLTQNLNARHLTARIHIWLASVLPPESAREHLEIASSIAQESGYSRLLEEIEALTLVLTRL